VGTAGCDSRKSATGRGGLLVAVVAPADDPAVAPQTAAVV